MADRPRAEVQIDAALVRRLLHDQHPDLAHLDLEEVSEGWDNTIVRLGTDLAVRLPRREQAAQLVLHEQQWLPLLGAAMDVSVPAPLRLGRPTDYFPWAWSVVPWLEGTEVGSLPVAHRTPLAIDLARCIVQLHTVAPPDAPANPFRGVPLARRDGDVLARLASQAIPQPDDARRVWADALAAPPYQGPPVWLHGDLHPFNMLARPAGPSTDATLCAVIDFGDMTSGDPACDLATAWLTFDAAGRAAFRDAVDRLTAADEAPGKAASEAAWRRARGWALVMATAMLAHSDDDPRFAILGARALTEILGEPPQHLPC